jgi:isopenicillin-N N-acyltransferase like protein
MRRRNRFWKRVLIVLLVLLILFGGGVIYVVQTAKINPPVVSDKSSLEWQRTEESPGFFTLKNNWFRKSKSGLYELYVEGSPFERGVVNGKLTRELVVKQEDYFSAQIHKMVPSNFYLHFLKYVVGWFNRNLDKNVTEEYKEEIYGISGSASDKYDYIGTNYQRILNYHAAHDIGHALQSMALVGCTSFGTWGNLSEDHTMIIGRNFDFYVGDQFAENKIVAFFNPSQGYKLMTVTWAGFIGAVSGMNEKGLTVTINADKTSIPFGSATPVSLVAREILQYAKNIDEAVAIAKKRKMFVSESFLIGSAEDNKAVIIEKTPSALDIYDPGGNQIICANHFQSKGLGQIQSNLEQIDQSASAYRYARVQELLQANGTNTVQKTVAILRNSKGLHDADIGLGNEKAINQFIAHHSIVFEPQNLKVWVSTSPWQLGSFVAYDLRKVFGLAGMKKDQEIADSSLNIPADTFLLSKRYQDFETFREYKRRLANGDPVPSDSLIASDPGFYHVYVLAADQLFRQQHYREALPYYQQALTKLIATKKEEQYIRSQIIKCQKKTTDSK